MSRGSLFMLLSVTVLYYVLSAFNLSLKISVAFFYFISLVHFLSNLQGSNISDMILETHSTIIVLFLGSYTNCYWDIEPKYLTLEHQCPLQSKTIFHLLNLCCDVFMLYITKLIIFCHRRTSTYESIR